MTIPQVSAAVLRRPADDRRPANRDERTAVPPRSGGRGLDDLALRILVVGPGLDRGWGAGRRSAPAPGIAGGLRAITGRPCEVALVGGAAADAESVAEDLAAHADRGCDGAVIALGAADAMRLSPVADWGARIVDLVEAVQDALPAGAPVLLVGAPAVHVPKRVQPLNPIALRHAARLDRVAQRLAEIRPGVRWVPAPELAKLVGRRPGADLDAAFSLPIASALAGALRDRRTPFSPLGPAPADRLDLRVLVDVARTEALAELSGLVRRAADEFGVQEAAVSLFDGESRWRITSTGTGPAEAALSLTCCETVVCTGDPLLLTDEAPDRFPAQARAGLSLPTSYAGVPVHAEDGTALGAICLLGPSARSVDPIDLDRLREFAHEAERVIRGVTAAQGHAPVD